MRSPEFSAYFLGRLENPEWIEPLEEAGLFDAVPTATTADDGTLSCPHWPASSYLARMAARAPDNVARILQIIETNNVAVLYDMLRAAAVMPAKIAASLVPTIRTAAAAHALGFAFKYASDFCASLLEGGEPNAALCLAQALYAPDFAAGSRRPQWVDAHWYEEGLRRLTPLLAASKGAEFVPELCNWLQAAMRASGYTSPDSWSDRSFIWRPAIEEHGQNPDYEFCGLLAGSARCGFECAIRAEQFSLTDALRTLGSYPFLVFKRLRLHLINEFAEAQPDLARRAILDRELFDDYGYKHEYARLVERRFGLLSEDERSQWLGWIDEPADRSGVINLDEQFVGKTLSDEDRRSLAESWQYEKLHWVRAYLTGARLEAYQRMRAARGEPHLADLNFRVEAGWRGDETPMTAEDLSALTFEQAVQVVSEWQPDGSRYDGPSLEGLAGTFGRYVATDLAGFSAQAGVLIERPAIYVRAFLEQMTEAVKAGTSIDVQAVVGLCEWVLAQPVDERTTPKQDDEALVDQDWQWCRDQIAGFLNEVCEARTPENRPAYPLDALRERLWVVIQRLCRDPAESYLHDPARGDPRVYDFLDMAINSSRGKALEAAFEYAWWVAAHMAGDEPQPKALPGGFDSIPEFREELEWQIAPPNRHVETLAIIGSRVGALLHLDRHWLAAHAASIFDLEGIEREPQAAEGWAAWNAFLLCGRPHIEFYRALKAQFAYAVKQAAVVEEAGRPYKQPMLSLGEHLMILYGRGQLGMDDDDGLLRQFLETAQPDVRCHAIEFVGRSLQSDEDVPKPVIDRFVELWEAYWGGKGPADAASVSNTGLFQTWFSSGKFDSQWSIDRLKEFVPVASASNFGGHIVEDLAKQADVDIAASVKILDSLSRRDTVGWAIFGAKDAIKSILERAMRAGGDARIDAVELIDYLGRRGFIELGELLKL